MLGAIRTRNDIHTTRVLSLDSTGRILDWMSWQDAVCLYVRGAVAWTLGDPCLTIHGGMNRDTGLQSRLDLHPIAFLILAQLIIFLLGWPLEWSEIIIIFVPIFLPLLPHFGIDPLFFGILVALNLQTSFLTPPMAMSAYYLKGIAPPQIQLVQIFRGCMPFLFLVFVSMILLYLFPDLTFWLPNQFYGR